MELAIYQGSDNYVLVIAERFYENLWTPAILCTYHISIQSFHFFCLCLRIALLLKCSSLNLTNFV